MADKKGEDTKFFVNQTITLITGAFSFVAAFAWNDLVKGVFDAYLPATGATSLWPKFFYALIVTLIVLLVLSRLQRIQRRATSFIDKRSHNGEEHEHETTERG